MEYIHEQTSLKKSRKWADTVHAHLQVSHHFVGQRYIFVFSLKDEGMNKMGGDFRSVIVLE